jgi:hypothetical protein
LIVRGGGRSEFLIDPQLGQSHTGGARFFLGNDFGGSHE